MKKGIFIIVACFLTGCSILPEGNEPLPLYTLKNEDSTPASSLPASLAIELPKSEPSLDTHRIAVTFLPYSRDYLANGQWSDNLPNTLFEYFVENFSERWGGAVINRAEEGLQTSYTLYSNVHDFSLYLFPNGCADVRLKINFRVIDFHNRRPIAGRTFSKKIQVNAYTMHGIMTAFNQGMGELLKETMLWIEDVVRNDKHS